MVAWPRIEASSSSDENVRQEVWILFGTVGRAIVSMFELTLANYSGWPNLSVQMQQLSTKTGEGCRAARHYAISDGECQCLVRSRCL